MKPLIGITSNYSYDDATGMTSNVGGMLQQWNLIAQDYINAVEKAGGIPVIVPIYESKDTLKELVKRIDGIVFSGGNDINPIHYNERATKEIGQITPNRDVQEIELMKYILKDTDIPVLGICRGHQILNVALGGSLHQDMLTDNLVNHDVSSIPMFDASHSINILTNSKLFEIISEENITVNSFHHQCIKELGKGLVAVAKDSTGIIEAIEYSDRQAMTLGVQWHPETLIGRFDVQNNIFKSLIASAKIS